MNKAFLLLVMLSALGCDPAPAISCAEMLYRSAFTREESEAFYRVTKKFLRDYKNEDSFYFWVSSSGEKFDTLDALIKGYSKVQETFGRDIVSRYNSRLVDLSGDELEQPNVTFCALCPWIAATPNIPLEYGVRVLQLRHSDQVQFADKRFTLDSFLGRGNATHVFGIAREPGQVLKIPFLAGNIERKRATPGWIMPSKWARSYLEQSVRTLQALPDDLPHVRVIEHAKNFEWAVMTRIFGDEDGRTFLRSLGHAPTADQFEKRARLFRNVARYIRLAHAGGQGKMLDPEKETDLFNTARQFMWNGSEWFLVDSD